MAEEKEQSPSLGPDNLDLESLFNVCNITDNKSNDFFSFVIVDG